MAYIINTFMHNVSRIEQIHVFIKLFYTVLIVFDICVYQTAYYDIYAQPHHHIFLINENEKQTNKRKAVSYNKKPFLFSKTNDTIIRNAQKSHKSLLDC